jgi:methylated-DNA-[protein]-cysteine S-methyltransferase
VLQATQSELARYFETGRCDFTIQVRLDSGTAFQRAVWRQLLRISPGQTVSYGNIANAIESPKAVRAVGAAVGRNPISIIVPCHRVLGAGGALTGYAGGLDRKTRLLQLEGAL